MVDEPTGHHISTPDIVGRGGAGAGADVVLRPCSATTGERECSGARRSDNRSGANSGGRSGPRSQAVATMIQP